MVTTVSGLLTKPGLMVWSTEAGDERLLLADLHDEAAAATSTIEVSDDHDGPATVAAITAMPNDRVVAIADTADGRRRVVGVDDPALAARVTAEEIIGSKIEPGGRR